MSNLSPANHCRRLLAVALIASPLLLAGCETINDTIYNAQHTDDNAELGEQIMDRHYLNGDLTADQFHQQVKVFNPNAQLPDRPAPTSPEPTESNTP